MGVLKLLQKEFVREILNDMELDFSLNISLKTGHFSHCQQNNNPLKHWVHHARSVEIAAATWPQVAEENSGVSGISIRDPGVWWLHRISRCFDAKHQKHNIEMLEKVLLYTRSKK